MDPITLPKISLSPQPTQKDIDEAQGDKTINSFGENNTLVVRSPETGKDIIFSAKSTVRGDKWFYPYPLSFEQDTTTIASIVEVVGEKIIKDILLDALSKLCQAKWKAVAGNGPTAELDFVSNVFEINRRTGEDTPEKIQKELNNLLKDIKTLKSQDKNHPDLPAMVAAYKALMQKQNDLILG